MIKINEHWRNWWRAIQSIEFWIKELIKSLILKCKWFFFNIGNVRNPYLKFHSIGNVLLVLQFHMHRQRPKLRSINRKRPSKHWLHWANRIVVRRSGIHSRPVLPNLTNNITIINHIVIISRKTPRRKVSC